MPDSATLGAAARRPRFVQLSEPDQAPTPEELSAGLLGAAASLPPKALHDWLGPRRFDPISELDDDAPLRTEAAILVTRAADIAAAVGTGRTLVDLGAGNGGRAGRLFQTLKPRRYVAVDVSVEPLRHALEGLQRAHPQMDILGVGLDFARVQVLPPEVGDSPRTLFYPGSAIGHFSPDDAVTFLRRARAGSPGGNLLIGVDLVRGRAALEAACDNAPGVSAAFTPNLLRHLNHRLGSDFDGRDWRSLAWFNESESRIETQLEARRELVVSWPGVERRFSAGERIHIGNSYKYRVEAFNRLLRAAGFMQTLCWCDHDGGFAVFCAAA